MASMAQPSAGQMPFDTLTEALGGLLVGHCLTSVTNFNVADAPSATRRGRPQSLPPTPARIPGCSVPASRPKPTRPLSSGPLANTWLSRVRNRWRTSCQRR